MPFIKTYNNSKILVSKGPKDYTKDIKGIKTIDKFNAHLWIHNNIVVKNHTNAFNFKEGDKIEGKDLMESLKTMSKFNL